MAWFCCALLYGVVLGVQVPWTHATIPMRVSTNRPPFSTESYPASIHPTKTQVGGTMSGLSLSIPPMGPPRTNGGHEHSQDYSSMHPSYDSPPKTKGGHEHSQDMSTSYDRPPKSKGGHEHSPDMSPSYDKPPKTK
ncbi:uncharacterized protein LOC110463915 [Mizuhopecten yessoensis]|uniref:uncharacterized protein LOC110463915 n=1 Tax=Mizuhopecten yessoensis TaxID=6573 RepID=UPI000B45E86A|nr:uncharacterized protein LOC110463915 [Mizuhopecten yessoensis]